MGCVERWMAWETSASLPNPGYCRADERQCRVRSTGRSGPEIAAVTKPLPEKESFMATVIEHVGGTYDVQSTEFGRSYRWVPDRVVVDCDCGETTTLTRSATACTCCGTNHSRALMDELSAGRREDEILHPWRYNGDCECVARRETGFAEIEFV